MSRACYTDDGEQGWELIMWRGAVKSAMRGKRGQAFLLEMRDALDAMPVKELATGYLHDQANDTACVLGVVGKARGLDMRAVDPEDYTSVAHLFGQSEAFVREVEFENDEGFWGVDNDAAARWRYKTERLTGPRRKTRSQTSRNSCAGRTTISNSNAWDTAIRRVGHLPKRMREGDASCSNHRTHCRSGRPVAWQRQDSSPESRRGTRWYELSIVILSLLRGPVERRLDVSGAGWGIRPGRPFHESTRQAGSAEKPRQGGVFHFRLLGPPAAHVGTPGRHYTEED